MSPTWTRGEQTKGAREKNDADAEESGGRKTSGFEAVLRWAGRGTWCGKVQRARRNAVCTRGRSRVWATTYTGRERGNRGTQGQRNKKPLRKKQGDRWAR